jgi:hypothetical protein
MAYEAVDAGLLRLPLLAQLAPEPIGVVATQGGIRVLPGTLARNRLLVHEDPGDLTTA